MDFFRTINRVANIKSICLQYHQLPKQIVTPYKPSEDESSSSLTRASSDVSDRAPLLKKVFEHNIFLLLGFLHR